MSQRTSEDLVESVAYAHITESTSTYNTYKDFLQTLFKLGCLKEFQRNCSKRHTPSHQKIDNYGSFLAEAFTWKGTPEGAEYWIEVHNQLEKIDIETRTEESIKSKEITMPQEQQEIEIGTVVQINRYAAPCYAIVTEYKRGRAFPFSCSNNIPRYTYREISSTLNVNKESFYGKVNTSNGTVKFNDCNSDFSLSYRCVNFTPDTIKEYVNTFAEKLTERKSKSAEKAKEETERKEELSELADSYKPKITIIDDTEKIDLEVPDSLNIQDKYTTIVGGMNDVINAINKTTSLGSQEELVEAFAKARESITKVSHVEPNTTSGLLTKYFGKSKWLNNKAKEAKRVMAENKSVKDNIDLMFGLMHEKYNRLVEVSTNLQKSKATLEAQIKALRSLEAESDENLSSYKEQVDIPTHELSLNTQIKGSIQKYIDRIAKVKGAITAMQATIIAFGRDLPAHKSDLEDEMALGGLLSNIDDYQKMFGEVKELVITVTDSTREKTYEVVDNLMKMQIEDTYTMEAIAKNVEAGKEFTTMLSSNSEKLAEKAVNDARFIKEVITGTPIEYARKRMKKLK